jgi:hypothetical protein
MSAIGETLGKTLRALRWVPAYAWQRLARRPAASPLHLVFAVADHFEPSILPEAVERYASVAEQNRRLEKWCREYPRALGDCLDSDGQPLRHTYFFPAEQYHEAIVGRLAEHCREGWGEIEVHLHHGIERPDTAERTRERITEFRDVLVALGCLSRWDGTGPAQYAFVHGNWALANSAGGRFCGVDGEMQVLADTGCYADFTLPAAPSPAQVGKINCIYECALPLQRRAPHRRGRDLVRGRPPRVFPLIVEGPLALHFARNGAASPLPRIENAALMASLPPSLDRLRLWKRAAIGVGGRPDWVFIKLHCHGMDPRDEEALYGTPMRTFLRQLADDCARRGDLVHFVTAREMVNILLAACDGREGNPHAFRDYRLQRIGSERRAALPV